MDQHRFIGILMACSLALLDIYFFWVVYKLLVGSKNIFALLLLFLCGVWQIQWYLVSHYQYVFDPKDPAAYFTWALPLQCWVFANRYFYSQLRFNATTTKITLIKHIYITVIFSIVIVALGLGLGFFGNKEAKYDDRCYEAAESNEAREKCDQHLNRYNLIYYLVPTLCEFISSGIALYSLN